MSKKFDSLIYLSGAPRVSTAVDTRTPGPASHILGIVGAAERHGMLVQKVIAGDTWIARRYLQSTGTENAGSGPLGLARDWARLAWDGALPIYARIKSRNLTNYLVYERYGLMQTAGRFLRARSSGYIVECNGIFFREAAGDRNNLQMVKVARRRELSTYAAADRIVAVSQKLKDEIDDLSSALGKKTIVVPNGVDTEAFAPTSFAPANRMNSYNLVWVGTVVAWQGLQDLIEALAVVTERTGAPVHLTVIGDGPDLRQLEDLTSRKSLSARFVGRLPRPAVIEELGKAHGAFAGHVALKSSGSMYHSPLKLYEYAAMGLPVVASESMDARSLLGPVGLERLIYQASNHEDLIRALTELIALPVDNSRRLALANLVRNQHSWDARLHQILESLG